MRALSSLELLQAWEQGLGLSGVERALILLEAACGDSQQEDLAKYSVGERDARLLTLREWTFGREVSAITCCPKCTDALELNFLVDDLRAEGAERTSTGPSTRPSAPLALEDGDYSLRFRLPNSHDLRALESASAVVVKAEQQILQRCLLEATCRGESIAVEQLPETMVAAVSERMTDADPQADIKLAVECCQCHHQWEEHFEIDSFFWTEINCWASRMLNEVHQLASAYGWSETEILGLSSLRRNLYLNLIAE
jgi:hypothetical protein